MEFLPRISRAQAMDVLSSQANLAGYKAVIDAAATFGRAMPMMMTAAGTIAPARVLVMGVGVAGLQAIATAKRLGAIVSRPPTCAPPPRNRWNRLGGTFVAVMDEEFKNAQTAAGYAKEMCEEYQAKQAALIAETIKKQDIVITTALIPGRKAPMLVTRGDDQDHEAGLGDRGPGGGARAATRRSPSRTRLSKSMASPSWATPICRARWRWMPRRSMPATCSTSSRLIVDKKTGALASTGMTRSSKARAVTKDGAVGRIRSGARAEPWK